MRRRATSGVRDGAHFALKGILGERKYSKEALAKRAKMAAKARKEKTGIILVFIAGAKKRGRKFQRKIDLTRACGDATGLKTATVEKLLKDGKIRTDDLIG